MEGVICSKLHATNGLYTYSFNQQDQIYKMLRTFKYSGVYNSLLNIYPKIFKILFHNIN